MVLPALADDPERATRDPYATPRIPILGKADKPPDEETDSVLSLRAEPWRSPHAEDAFLAPNQFADGTEFPDRQATWGARSPAWKWAVLAALGVLAGQALVFEGAHWAQNPRYRPWLDKLCAIAGRRLPEFRDLTRVEIIERGLTPARGGVDGLEFRAVIANYANQPQRFPDLRLTLTQYDGDPIAQRQFSPAEYLSQAPMALMAVGAPTEVQLLIANPGRSVGGFTIDLR